ncbi:MFS transporter [Chryseolinea sp. T2]|uniref:MFS transporter n=1 Tax=Chryseolinea sp. T2 TaxID=3129255 RepID=UPI0030780E7A
MDQIRRDFRLSNSGLKAVQQASEKQEQMNDSSFIAATQPSISRYSLLSRRVGVSVFFILHGLCFASWASRIPTIQEQLQLNEAALGTILFALPVGFFVSLPFSGWLIARLHSKKVVLLSSTCYSLSLIGIGVATTGVQIAVSLLLFGFFANMLNISMNTQAVAIEQAYGKRLLASFHGLWSLAGFAGAATGAWMISHNIDPFWHFVCIACVFVPGLAFATRFLSPGDRTTKEKQSLLALPDKSLLGLGLIAFCSMMVEGAMFDWSGVYMSKVVQATRDHAAMGYSAFMIAMTTMRFMADAIAARFGLRRTLQLSGSLATTGLLLAVVSPQFAPALIAFALVGMGVSAVVPMVYSAAGQSTNMAPGIAITAVSSLGFMGFLIGPPSIGFIAAAATLRGSFIALMFMAIAVVLFSTLQRFPADRR